jgi:2,3-bisphosphoglycerate-independent phosphoglycerate mutase
VSGRYWARDRDKRWERTKLAYDAIVHGEAPTARSAGAVIEASYQADITDEFIKPHVIVGADGKAVGPIRDGDSVVLFNFRADRMRQIVRALAFEEFDGFDRARGGAWPRVAITTMTEYDPKYTFPIVYPSEPATGYIAEVLAAHKLTNLRLAETEKYAHVTYFFNCGREQPYTDEERILIPSQKVATYDLMPQMSAPGIAEAFVADVSKRLHHVIICNFANADMVGHTGRLDATTSAIGTLDDCLGKVLTAVRAAGGTAIVTADHGNAEQMWDDELKAPHTAHTSNPVPVILVGDAFLGRRLRDGTLRDVAPTILGLLGIAPSPEMTGGTLLEE